MEMRRRRQRHRLSSFRSWGSPGLAKTVKLPENEKEQISPPISVARFTWMGKQVGSDEFVLGNLLSVLCFLCSRKEKWRWMSQPLEIIKGENMNQPSAHQMKQNRPNIALIDERLPAHLDLFRPSSR